MRRLFQLLFLLFCYAYIVGPVLILSGVGLCFFNYVVSGVTLIIIGLLVLFFWLLLRKTKFIGG